MNNTTQLIICCLLFTSSLTICNLTRSIKKLTIIPRVRRYSSAQKYADHIKDLNLRLLTLTENIFQSTSDVDLSKLKGSLERGKNSKSIIIAIDDIFSKQFRDPKVNPSRKVDLYAIQKHVHRLVRERDEKPTS